MRLHFIDEPELEFGGAGRHIDIRHGLAEHGSLDRGLPSAPQLVRVGVVGAGKDIERLRAWFDRCRAGIDAKKSKRTTLFVGFPGFSGGGTFCDFVVDDRLIDSISGADLREISEADDAKFRDASIDRYLQGAADLIEKANAQVVLCLLPEEFVRRIDVPTTPETGPRAKRRHHRDDEVVSMMPSRPKHSTWRDRCRSCGRRRMAVACTASGGMAPPHAKCRTKRHAPGTSFARFTTRQVASRGGWRENRRT